MLVVGTASERNAQLVDQYTPSARCFPPRAALLAAVRRSVMLATPRERSPTPLSRSGARSASRRKHLTMTTKMRMTATTTPPPLPPSFHFFVSVRFPSHADDSISSQPPQLWSLSWFLPLSSGFVLPPVFSLVAFFPVARKNALIIGKFCRTIFGFGRWGRR